MDIVTIWVKFQKQNMHRWPGAPAKVAFLQNAHRHTFHVDVELEVKHDDRELEFYLFREELGHQWDLQIGKCGEETKENWSCEMMAAQMGVFVRNAYMYRHGAVTVSEEGTQGATYRWRDRKGLRNE